MLKFFPKGLKPYCSEPHFRQNFVTQSLHEKTITSSLVAVQGHFSMWVQCCPYVLKGDTVQATAINKSSRITSFINCNTRYLVYVITCRLCHMQYVGRMACRLCDRLHDILYDIQKDQNTNVARLRNDIHHKEVSSNSFTS